MSDNVPETERVNPLTAGLDELATGKLVELLVEENRCAVDAVALQAESIARVVDGIVERLSRGGSLHYVGAGTSGRIAYLDASEVPPTFGVSSELVRAHIAGGETALTRAVEGAEDDGEAGRAEMERGVRSGDAVIGISASGGARYVVAALEKALEIGAYTVALCNNPNTPLSKAASVCVVLRTGTEVLAGSTRLKAGTAQKITLNAISTAVMVRLGKVRGNLMIDVAATNEKLQERAVRIVMEVRSVSVEEARELLVKNDWNLRACMP